MPPPGGWPDDAGDLPGIDPDFWVRFSYYREWLWRHHGIVVGVRDGSRSQQLQIQRRIENCGGNTHYNIWQKPPSQCRPVTAIPGTSKHEKGQAIDQAPHWTVHWAIREAANMAGLEFDVPSEAWHIVPKWSNNKPGPKLADLPRIFGFTLGEEPTAPPAPPPEVDMDRHAGLTIGGIEFEIVLYKNGLGALCKFSPAPGALPPASPATTPLAGWANFADYVGGWRAAKVSSVIVLNHRGRFRVVFRDIEDRGVGYSCFQRPGDEGLPPDRWDMTGFDGTGWFPA